jgi:ABC-2 type transport system ATP-binding protein
MDITLARGSELGPALRVLASYSDGEPRVEPERRFISLAITNGAHRLPAMVRDLDAALVRLDDLNLRKPTLDDVFLSLTGHAAESASADPEEDDHEDGGDTKPRRRSGADNRPPSDITSQEVHV